MTKEWTTNRNKDHILNMDWTPIAYLFHAQKILEVKRSKTILVCASTMDTKRVAVAATVTASRKMLPPFMIFKGAPNGRIAT